MTITQPKQTIKEVLDNIVQALINDTEYKVNIGKLPDSKVIVVDVLVPPQKVGVMLGKMDEFGRNPTKIAVYRLIKQVSFYHGFSDVVLKIDEIKPEIVRA